MITNYLKTTLRHIRNNKGFSIINIFGLSLGMAVAILILLWVKDEVNYNTSNEKYDRLYSIQENQTYDGKTYTFSATPGLLAAGLRADFPEIQNTCRVDWGDHWLFSSGESGIFEDGLLVDSTFMDMFTFPMIAGTTTKSLDENSILISERMADKFFQGENAVGKYLKVNDKEEKLIKGVFSNPPLNNSLQFDWLSSFRIFEKENDWWNSWSNNGMQTFVELKHGVDVNNLNSKLNLYIKSKEDEATARPFVFPMKDWRLRSQFVDGKVAGGRIAYVRLFGIIAILIIFIACINFMNLATARSEKRIREVGVRKVMGAERVMLFKQFIGESLLMSVIAMLFACIIVLISLPFFNQLVVKKLSLSFMDPSVILIMILITGLCGLIAGSYPALYLSSFSPASIFKRMNAGKGSGAVIVRKTLVVTQFTISIILMVSTIIIYMQIRHVKSRQLGYDKENLIYTDIMGYMRNNMDVIKNDLTASGFVKSTAASSQTILSEGNNTGGFNWPGKDPSKQILVTQEYVTPGFINTAGMNLISGRDFNPDGITDSSNVIINESFANIIGKKNLSGEIIYIDTFPLRIIGVVKDFLYNNFYIQPGPYIMYCKPETTFKLFIKLKDHVDMEAALAKISAIISKHNPGYPFEYKFFDEEFDKTFRSEMLIGKLSRLFAILTIFISSLGLFGLAAYTAERRTKEIGIRKVLGASISDVVKLLSNDFLKLVLISIILATPLSWIIMKKWLDDYAYRITIQWWFFIGAGILAIFLAIITVSSQAIKAGIMNPVKSLRTE